MKHTVRKIVQLFGIALIAILAVPVIPAPLKFPTPDPALVASIDVRLDRLYVGISCGDFEAWYPGLYPGYF